MTAEELIAVLDTPLPGFRQYVQSSENLFDTDSVHGVFAACSHFTREHTVTEDAWRALASILNRIVGAKDEDLDNAACTCFLENVAAPDHPLRRHLRGEGLAYWHRWETGDDRVSEASTPITAEQFEWDGHFLKAELGVDPARGYRRCHPEDAWWSETKSDGTVRVVFAPEGRDEGPLQDSELASVRWFFDHAKALFETAVGAVYQAYPALQSVFDLPEDERKYMPDLRSLEDLRGLLGLHTVYVHQVSKKGVPYLGLHFLCTWDDEHDTGVLMHGTRVVEVGDLSTAFLLWKAEEDAERSSPPR